MPAEKRWHVLLSVMVLLVTSSQCVDSGEEKQREHRTLLDVLLQALGDEQRDRTGFRRLSLFSTSAQHMKLSSRERDARLAKLDASRPIEIVPRDVSVKDKFIKHFTGPVKFSSECRTHFHRIYHNTRDCARPAYYKRCARLLTRLAMSPLCSQP